MPVASLADVFAVLNRMRDEGVIAEYAVGGATAVLFYAEPTRTYDVDVFVLFGPDSSSSIVSLTPIYEWARAAGFTVHAEHLMIHGVPVQILPAYNLLVEEAVREARVLDYDGTAVRVVGPEHLVALALQGGGARRRERAWLLIQADAVDRVRLRSILHAHEIHTEIPNDV